jgi:hypothetical protein
MHEETLEVGSYVGEVELDERDGFPVLVIQHNNTNTPTIRIVFHNR